MTNEIIDLINKNEELSIYAFVDYEVVGGDFGSWVGSIRSAQIKEYAKVETYGYDDRDIVFKDDQEEYIEFLLTRNEDMTEEDAVRISNNLSYKKAIFLNVSLPDNM